MWKATGSYRTYSIPGKAAVLVPQFAIQDLLSEKLQPRFLSLQWRTCPWAEHTDDYILHYNVGRRAIGISGSPIWSKTLMELIFNPCSEFRWSPEGPVIQIHSPRLLVGAPGIYSDLLRFVQILKWEWGAESNGKLPHLFIPSKTAT